MRWDTLNVESISLVIYQENAKLGLQIIPLMMTFTIIIAKIIYNSALDL